MQTKRCILTLLAACILAGTWAQKSDMNKFIDQLLQKMTLEEKLGQLNLAPASEDIVTGGAVDTEVGTRIASGQLGGIFNRKGVDKIKVLQDIAVKKSRLGIPLIVGMDVIHGYETIFPIPLALSCSWDLEAIENMACISAREASADGINWVYSPMVDIALDARWGRVAESGGEDPFLGAEIAKAYVRGYQGSQYDTDKVMACVKHYGLYGAVEAGRDYNTVDMSHLRMYNQYFPPYRAAAEAGAGSFMSSFNLVDGQHATANRWLLTDVLRDQWKFGGFVVTDYGSIGEMSNHGLGSLKQNSAKALKAGTDMDMCSNGFIGTLAESLKDGSVTMADIDLACRRVLEAKYKLGLFDDPYRYLDAKRRARDIFTDEHRAMSRQLATETFVLLKNDHHTLPLKKQGKIALIGPLANDRANIAGTWCVAYTPERYQTIKEGMEQALAGKAQLLYAQGCNLTRDAALQEAAEFGKHIPRVNEVQAKAEALAVAREADVIVCAMGECADFSGESSSRATLEMPDVQRELLEELVALGKPVVLLNFSGRATVLTWEQAHVDAIMNVWFAGSEAGKAIADVLFGEVSPSGHLTVTMPRALGQVPIYYNHLNTGRPVPEGADRYQKFASNYLEVRNDPLYPFGYGLSYTTFAYDHLRLSADQMGTDGSVEAIVKVTNTGNYDAAEVVQLYIRDLVADVSRPIKELKGFKRIYLKAGEQRDVKFVITPEMLQYYDINGHVVKGEGEFDIMVGSNSRDVLTTRLMVATPKEKFVRVSGPDLIRPDGRKLFIQGTNLGNWLNPEGYMFGLSRTNSAWMIDLMIKEAVGPDFAADFWRVFKDNYITRADIEFIAQQGANTIRLPFNYKLFTDEDYMGLSKDQDGFARMDSVVTWCRDNGLYLILDMHDCPGGQTGDNIDDGHGYPWLFESERSQALFCDIWQRIARKYKDEPVILGYELANEPIAHYFENKEELNQRLEPLYKRAVKAIREVDRNHIILLGGARWNSDFYMFKDWAFDDNIIYTCHRYGGEATAAAIKDYIDFRDKTGLPMYMGEIGHNTDEWQAQFVEVMKQANIGYTFWPYKKIDGSCMMGIQRPEGWDSIVVKYSETPRGTYQEWREARPDQTKFRELLMQYAENSRFERCQPQENYIKSLGLR